MRIMPGTLAVARATADCPGFSVVGGGDSVALLAGRAVGDVAHRVDRLVGRATGNQRPASGKRSLPPRRAAGRGHGSAIAAEKRFDGAKDFVGFGHPAFAHKATCQFAVSYRDEMIAVRF